MADELAKLVSQLEDADSSVKRAAAAALAEHRNSVSADHAAAVVALLACDTPASYGGGAISPRRAALLALTGMCEDWATLPRALATVVPSALALLLVHEDEDTREVAARAMGVLGAHAKMLPLVTSMRDEEPAVARAALDALASMSVHVGRPVLEAVLALLADDEPSTRANAAELLGNFLRVNVLRALEAGAPRVAELDSAGRERELLAQEAFAAVSASLADEEEEVQAAAARAIGNAGGERGATQLEALVAIAQDEASTASLRAAAVGAVGSLDAEGVQGDVLAELLGASCRELREAAAMALKRQQYAA